jgi:hypothetical protein
MVQAGDGDSFELATEAAAADSVFRLIPWW